MQLHTELRTELGFNLPVSRVDLRRQAEGNVTQWAIVRMQHIAAGGQGGVQQAIVDGISTVRCAGNSAGVLAADTELARKYIELGAIFVAVGLDTDLLVRSATDLAKRFKP
jgi:hypothetical protein